MTAKPDPIDGTRRLSRRAAFLAPLALGGCSVWDGWFGEVKQPLPGRREPILASRRGLSIDETAPKIKLPQPVVNAAWPQAGGNPAHVMGHLAGSERLASAWNSNIGDGGGYRRVILAQPVVADGLVYTMDSEAMVAAFDLAGGGRAWRYETRDDESRSTNIGGGLCVDGGTLFAVNGLTDLVALDAKTGALKWRTKLDAPARSAPTVADGRIFITTLNDRLTAFATTDGHVLWSYRAAAANATMLGQPAPAYARGLVVAGFGSGELAAIRADTGTVVWTDGLGASRGRSGLADFLSIRGAPVISNGRVFAIGMGGLTVSIDLPTGRRLWERQIAGVNNIWAAGDWIFLISMDQEVAALNADDGQVAWLTALPRWEDPDKRKDPMTWFGPVLIGDRLIVTGRSEEALAISPYTGAILGRQRLSGAAAPIAPIVVDRTLLVVTDDGRLSALR